MPRERFTPLMEKQELEMYREIHLRRLAGIVEVGGQLGFGIHRSVKSHFVYPFIGFNDNLDRVTTLSQVYGGNKVKQSENSWTWRVTGQRAADIRPWTPSRVPIIDAFQELTHDGLSFDEAVDLSRLFLGTSKRRTDVNMEEYMSLVSDRAFLAGIIDGRGILLAAERWDQRSSESFSTTHAAIYVASVNQPLLLALQETYGGAGETRNTQGQERVIQGQAVAMRQDTFRWTVKVHKAEGILAKVDGFSLLRDQEIKKLLANFATS